MIDINQINFSKMNGLVPAVIVDSITEQVLMTGFMNQEAYQKTVDTRRVTFWSRTKKSSWTKGATSGNYLELIEIKADCDIDSLLIYAKPFGNTCHTGNYSCFGIEKNNLKFLSQLFALIQKRRKELPGNSYTAKLFEEGSDRIIQKVGEEAVETLITAKNKDKQAIVNEVSDLIYHLFVMLADQDIELDEVVDKLVDRHKK
jgi:phosphoribosyl-ATP pyrophosphohydrolase/phosphoribosyl-AMP cyclohydrolase